MASGRQFVDDKTRSTAIVPIRIAAEHADAPEDPRLSDVDEWGRSERTRTLARALYEPIYSKWFRTEWEGLEKIPTEGGALLVANHAGAIPSDAPVITWTASGSTPSNAAMAARRAGVPVPAV